MPRQIMGAGTKERCSFSGPVLLTILPLEFKTRRTGFRRPIMRAHRAWPPSLSRSRKHEVQAHNVSSHEGVSGDRRARMQRERPDEPSGVITPAVQMRILYGMAPPVIVDQTSANCRFNCPAVCSQNWPNVAGTGVSVTYTQSAPGATGSCISTFSAAASKMSLRVRQQPPLCDRFRRFFGMPC